MPLGAMQPLIKRQRCERGPSASRCIHCKNFVRQSMGSRGADKQSVTTVGRRGVKCTKVQTFRHSFHGSLLACYVDLHGVREPLADDNHAALREAVLPAQPVEPRATNHVAKGPTRGGRRVVVVAGNAQQHALQDVVG